MLLLLAVLTKACVVVSSVDQGLCCCCQVDQGPRPAGADPIHPEGSGARCVRLLHPSQVSSLYTCIHVSLVVTYSNTLVIYYHNRSINL